MRTSITSFTVTALSLLTIATPLVSASAAHEQRSSAHKRVVNSRTNQEKRDDAAAGLAALNNALASGGGISSSGTSGGLAKAVAGAPPAANATAASSSAAAAASSAPANTGCFPSANFKMPANPPANTDNWWCDLDTEYAFVGFSYEVTACQSASQLQKEFKDMKQTYGSRYVRLYGACDKAGFIDDVVNAAWDNGLGLHQLIWFGFTGGNEWQKRRDAIYSNLKSNPKAKFVTRVVQFGSEPLFDQVLPESQLASNVKSAKQTLKQYGVNVTVSDMAYGFQENGGAQDVLNAMDWVNAHMLPFFSTKATTGSAAWPLVQTDIEWFQQHAKGKKIYMDENAWPSTTYEGVQANSAKAVANVNNEGQYFDLLDSKCSYFKQNEIAWFMHLYSDDQEPGYGLYGTNGKTKFNFKPKTAC